MQWLRVAYQALSTAEVGSRDLHAQNPHLYVCLRLGWFLRAAVEHKATLSGTQKKVALTIKHRVQKAYV